MTLKSARNRINGKVASVPLIHFQKMSAPSMEPPEDFATDVKDKRN